MVQCSVTRKLLVLLFGLMLVGNAAIAQQLSPKNTILFNAMSPYEDLVEFALSEDAPGTKAAIQSLEILPETLTHVLSKQAAEDLTINFQKIIEAEEDRDFPGIAEYAVDSYKVLTDQLDAESLTVPKEVAVLDFVGFKIHALLKQENLSWDTIDEVVRDGRRQWDAIRENVSNKAIKDAMDTAIGGLQTAVKTKNIEMLKFAAQVDLDLVDLLEGYFESRQ